MTANKSIEVDRRMFLKTAGALALGQLVASDVDAASIAEAAAKSRAQGKPPYRVIFSNDSTNVISCTSPYHKRGEDWRPEMLEATVDEVAGKVDAHFIQQVPASAVVPEQDIPDGRAHALVAGALQGGSVARCLECRPRAQVHSRRRRPPASVH